MTELDRGGHERGCEGGVAARPDDLDSLADEELVRRYQRSREARAFTVMVHRHRPMVLRTCRRLAGNLHDAEDAAQTVFLLLAKRPEVVRRSLAGCLHGLARAAVSELCRSARRRTERETVAAGMRSLFDRLGRGGQSVEHHELREELDAALGQLPDHLHQAVILRYLEGLSQEEAARRAGCTTTTMGWRSMKGLQRLRGALSRRGVSVSTPALLAFLGAEAGSAAAGVVIGPASAVAVRTAAALANRPLPGAAAIKLGLALLFGSGVALGVVLGVNLPIRTAPSPQPRSAPEVTRERPLALGLFDRSVDIGGPAHAGEATVAGDTYTVRGGGAEIYGAADQFRFAYRPWTGDGEIVARLHSERDQEGRQVCAGVMFRETLAVDSHHATILLGSGGKCHVKWRDAKYPASACDISGPDEPGRYWVRLVRRGDTFTAYTRPDGAEAWRLVKELRLPMKSAVYVGLAVTAHDDAKLATTTFDRVSISGQPKR